MNLTFPIQPSNGPVGGTSPLQATLIGFKDTNGLIQTPTYSTPVPVSLGSLISGEDQTNNWLATANGANQYYQVFPGSTGIQNGYAGFLIGSIGAAGDYLDKLQISATNSNYSRVYLQDISAVSATSGGLVNAPMQTSTNILFGTNTTTVSADAYKNQFIIVNQSTYTPGPQTITGTAGSTAITVPLTQTLNATAITTGGVVTSTSTALVGQAVTVTNVNTGTAVGFVTSTYYIIASIPGTSFTLSTTQNGPPLSIITTAGTIVSCILTVPVLFGVGQLLSVTAGTGSLATGTTITGISGTTITLSSPVVTTLGSTTLTSSYPYPVARKIITHTATQGTSGSYYISCTIDLLPPAITYIVANSSTQFICPLLEIVPSGFSGTDVIGLQIKSKYGGWKIFTDSGVSVNAIGKYS